MSHLKILLPTVSLNINFIPTPLANGYWYIVVADPFILYYTTFIVFPFVLFVYKIYFKACLPCPASSRLIVSPRDILAHLYIPYNNYLQIHTRQLNWVLITVIFLIIETLISNEFQHIMHSRHEHAT